MAASLQEGTQTPPQTTNLTTGNKKKKTLKKVSTQPSQTEGFGVS